MTGPPTEFIFLGWGRRLNANDPQIPTKIPTEALAYALLAGGSAARNLVVQPEAKIFGDLEINLNFGLSAMSG